MNLIYYHTGQILGGTKIVFHIVADFGQKNPPKSVSYCGRFWAKIASKSLNLLQVASLYATSMIGSGNKLF